MGQVVTGEKIRQARDFYKLHFGYNLFNEEGEFVFKCQIVWSRFLSRFKVSLHDQGLRRGRGW